MSLILDVGISNSKSLGEGDGSSLKMLDFGEAAGDLSDFPDHLYSIIQIQRCFQHLLQSKNNPTVSFMIHP